MTKLNTVDRRKSASEDKSKEHRKNSKVIAIFDWMRQKERVVNIDKTSLKEDFINFPKSGEDISALNGWGSVGAAPALERGELVEAPTGKTTTAPEVLDDENIIADEGESVILGPDSSQEDEGEDGEEDEEDKCWNAASGEGQGGAW